MADEKDYGFGQGENVVTIVQRTPRGVEVIEAKEAELESLDLVAPGPGVSQDVVPTAPRGDGPVSPGLSELTAPVDVREVPAKAVLDAPVKKSSGAKARIASDVGPDPKQEAAKTVPVTKTVKKP